MSSTRNAPGGSIDSTPISNFETNTASFRTPSHARTPSRHGSTAPQPALAKRIMDIEDLLWWTYRDELPKGRDEREGEPSAVSPIFRMGLFGARIDNWSREPGFPLACGEPHPDAVLVDAAVQRLDRFAGQVPDGDLGLMPDFAAFGVDEAEAMAKALKSAAAIVVQNAKLRQRPFWSSKTAYAGMMQPNGKPMVMSWETFTSPTISRTNVAYEALVPVEALKKNTYPTGAHCPLRFDPDPTRIAQERAEYAVWWGALDALAAELSGQLASIAVLPPGAAQRPWQETRELGKPPRVFGDLSASVYRRQQRETAAAHRALGQRRPIGIRGASAARFAPKRASIASAATG